MDKILSDFTKSVRSIVVGSCKKRLMIIAIKQTIEPTPRKLPSFLKSRFGFIATMDKPRKMAPVAPKESMMSSAPFENVVK